MSATVAMHFSVGRWHGPLCGLGRHWKDGERLTLARERVTCQWCLVVWDALEERGWPVKRRLQWWEGYTRKRDKSWHETLWTTRSGPTNVRKRHAKLYGRRLERIPVVDPRSLQHHAESLSIIARSTP